MRAIVIDASGKILRSVHSTTKAGLVANLQPGGAQMYLVPDSFGLIDDSQLTAPGGVLTAAPGVSGVQHAGESLTLIPTA